MAEITTIDHVLLGLSRLPSEMLKKPYVVGWLKSYLQELQKIEDTAHQLNTERGLPVAIGAQLDVIGALLGVPREGRDDITYRFEMFDAVASSEAVGTPDDIIDSIYSFTDSTFATVFEHPFANVHAYTDTVVSQELVNLLDKISPAGVNVITIFDDGGGESFIPAEYLVTQQTFQTMGGEDYFLDSGSGPELWTITAPEFISSSSRAVLPELRTFGVLTLDTGATMEVDAGSGLEDLNIGTFLSGSEGTNLAELLKPEK